MKYHTKCVIPELIEILAKLAKKDILSGFKLGGGTSLALRYGHRKSIDIDLFSVNAFESLAIQNELTSTFPTLEELNRTKGSLCLSINNVKVDILYHPAILIMK